MNKSKIDGYSKILEISFGLWITALFENIKAYNKQISFLEHKSAFFEILRDLLEEKKVYFEDPDSPFGSGKIWNIGTDETIKYLLEKWPTEANDSEDQELNIYMYTIPAIMWVGDDGCLYSS